ncbi:hypothetical protein PYW08_016669 [Mythimna loreyi]|uniref:Uncharacterized protein n=1 Tax=Mythimna loreyi TaxID=667449 RepID=A0ACC2R2W0_9NEOP|nr:hypothetical protein PYW08_016669 [Mythimna loreyi]
MRALCTKKTAFFIIIILVIVMLHNAMKTVKSSVGILPNSVKFVISDRTLVKSELDQNVSDNRVNLKYILQWTSPHNVPFVYMGKGQEGFIERKCPYTNCIVTADRSYFGGDYTKFDVIAFAGPELSYTYQQLPVKRSSHQKYVFASIESSDNYPVCSTQYNGFFNWTWTFKLDSEVRWGYFTIRDKNNAIVGPNKEMQWMKLEDMDPVSEDFKQELKTKTKAAAWFVSNCYTKSKRENVASKLNHELRKYNLSVDVFGKCGPLKCSRDNEDDCDKLIKSDYYFYLSFENSFSEDYVTEKLLRALNNNAVPIVYGGADYNRFMPDGIYLDARLLDAKSLTEKMYELMNDPEKYAEYFKWRNHYTYHRQSESVETEPYCLFCTTLNTEEMVKKTTVYEEFRNWWNGPKKCQISMFF